MSQLVVFLALSAVTWLGAGAAARAAETAMYYAAPTMPAPPLIAEGKASKHAGLPHERVCFNAAETRERIADHKLAEPFQALESGSSEGEALRAKLCRWKKDEFVYEIAVLRRDGHIVNVYMNAQNGHTVGR